MIEVASDVTGYELARARDICEREKVKISEVICIGPSAERCDSDRQIVIRQRDADGGRELTVSCVWAVPEDMVD